MGADVANNKPTCALLMTRMACSLCRKTFFPSPGWQLTPRRQPRWCNHCSGKQSLLLRLQDVYSSLDTSNSRTWRPEPKSLSQEQQWPHSARRHTHSVTGNIPWHAFLSITPLQTYMHRHTHTHTHSHTHTYTCTAALNTNMCIHTNGHMHSETKIHTYIYMPAYMCTHTHMRTHSPAHTHTHTHKRIHTHSHTHTHIQYDQSRRPAVSGHRVWSWEQWPGVAEKVEHTATAKISKHSVRPKHFDWTAEAHCYGAFNSTSTKKTNTHIQRS